MIHASIAVDPRKLCESRKHRVFITYLENNSTLRWKRGNADWVGVDNAVFGFEWAITLL